MSTLTEIEEAIEQLPPVKFTELRQWIERRSKSQQVGGNPLHSWPVPPPHVERMELDRIEAEIETEFPTLSRYRMLLDTNAISAWAKDDAALLRALRTDRTWFLPSIALGEYRYGLLKSTFRVELARDN